MALIVSKQKEIDEYFASERLSQSTLKKLLEGFSKFVAFQQKEDDGKENQSFIIGSAVDCILTGEEGEFENQYYVSNLEKKPSDVEMAIVDYVFQSVVATEEKINDFVSYQKLILEAADFHKWQLRWKTETRISKLIDAGSEYFQELINSLGKTIITTEDDHKISQIVFNLRNHHRTKELFDRSLYENNPHVDIYYQLPIYFTMNGIECKSLLDMLLVFRNPDTNKIESVQPVDLKTMQGDTINFLWSVKKWRYDIQAAFYTEAIKNYIYNTLGVEHNFVLHPFKFVVESTSNPGQPLVFTMTEELMNIGKYGRSGITVRDIIKLISSDFYRGTPIVREIKGFLSLLEEYKYYSENEWKEDKRITEGNGVLKLDWDGINLE